MHTYICLYRGFVLVRRGFCGGFCLRIFVWKVLSRGGFCPYPFPSQYIRYNRKLLNITFNFRCCMQEFFCMLLYPSSPVTNCHTSSDPSPLERAVLYGRPLIKLRVTLGILFYDTGPM